MWPSWVTEIADDKLFQSLAGLASILALLITLRIWWITRRIAARISANVRLPDLGKLLAADLTELNRLNLTNAPVQQIGACLAVCRSRLRSIRRYRAGIRRRQWVVLEISITRLAALVGVEPVARRLSYQIYGELQEVVADIEDFTARIPFGAEDG